MFQILENPNYNFMGRARMALGVAATLVLLSIGVLLVNGLNRGIEFTGGTEVQLKYRERPAVGEIRAKLEQAGFHGTVVTTIGSTEENEIYVRLPAAAGSDEVSPSRSAPETDLTSRVTAVLRSDQGGSGLDLNLADKGRLAEVLRQSPELGADRAAELAERIVEARRDAAIFESLDDVAGIEEMDEAAMEQLRRAGAALGDLSVRSQSYIGPAVGQELMRKTVYAVIGSLIGMLLYIGFRFQIVWGFAAVVALFHDTLVTLGLFSLFDLEMSLPVVAAFLTLIGYSTNDTVVVFDRIRENLKARGVGDLPGTINASINQTLSRTVITSGLTWLVCCALYLFGGPALSPFAFVLTVGVIVGTFSSIFVASPILVITRRALDRRRARASAEPGARRARKVRTGSAQGA